MFYTFNSPGNHIVILTARSEDYSFCYGGKDKIIFVKDKPLLVYFSASWCAICHTTKPIIAEIDSLYTGKIDILYIDTEIDKEVSKEFEISSLPLLFFYRNGKRDWIHVGKITKLALKEKIGVN